MPIGSTPAAPGLVLIGAPATVGAAVAAVDFVTGITAAYDEYELHYQSVVPASSGARLQALVSVDAGASWLANYNGGINFTTATGGTPSWYGAAGRSQMELVDGTFGVSSAASHGGTSGVLRIFSPANAVGHKLATVLGAAAISAGNASTVSGAWVAITTAAVNALRFKFDTGNVSGGTFRLYGVRKS